MLVKHLTYWLLPGVFITAALFMYFSGIHALEAIIAPKVNREFGLLEHVQLLLLLAALAMSSAAAWRDESRLRKVAFSFIALSATFLILEETDYGLHYWEALSGQPAQVEVRNIHNQGRMNKILKRISYYLMAIVFVVLPLVREKIKVGWIRDFIPSRWILSTGVLLVTVPEIAHFLEGKGLAQDGGLRGNLSEFAETLTYYVVLLYVVKLYGRQQRIIARPTIAPARQKDGAAA